MAKNIMFSNYNHKTYVGNDQQVLMPENLKINDDKCLECNTQLTIKSEIRNDVSYECKYCRGSWNGGCNCTFEKYKCTYISCEKCIKNYKCFLCKIYVFDICKNCNICEFCIDKKILNERINKINYVLKVNYNEKDEAKKLGAKWDVNQKIWFIPYGIDYNKFTKWKMIKYNNNIIYDCRSCFIECEKCKIKYYKKYITYCIDLKITICKECIYLCDLCYKMNSNNLIIYNNNKMCEKCFYIKYNPNSKKKKYELVTKNTSWNYNYFDKWLLIEINKNCKCCNDTYWFIINDNKKPKWSKYPSNCFPYKSWQRDDYEYLENLCEKCYDYRHDKLLNKFINKNPNPSNINYIYCLDNYNFRWVKTNIINYCKKCNGQIILSENKKNLKDNFKYCKNCDPTDKNHKYIFTDNWILKKVRIFDGKHKWIKPTNIYNENYNCACIKCK